MDVLYRGIDVSKHNGVIDWERVKKSGVQFAMIRAGYGQNIIDAQFKRNISECNRLGIPCGVYWFSYAVSVDMAVREAMYCLEAIEPYKLDFPVAFDFEYDSVDFAARKGAVMTKSLASAIARSFCEVVEKEGYYVVNYSNSDYLNRYFDDSVKDRYDLWLARWPKTANLTQPPRCGIWQYSNKGAVDGINGYVDLNAAYNDYPAIISKMKGVNENGEMQEESKPQEAQEVTQPIKYYETIQQVPKGEMRTLVENLVDKGIIRGNGSGLHLSDDMVRTLVFLHRAGAI